MSCDVGKARKGWRMSCDIGEVTERLENEHHEAQKKNRNGEKSSFRVISTTPYAQRFK